MDILRFITAGCVDHGKSTLIGRLLYDSNAVLNDQISAVAKHSKSSDGNPDLSLLTDGLKAEREQGITIDVAYKYFSTEKRKFIIADCPGHAQYTRNMVTGASNSELSVILLDVINGITAQTKRHTIISSLLGIKNLVVCINKMDIINYSEKVFNELTAEFSRFAASLSFSEICYIPVSALTGENIVRSRGNTPWYNGKSLLNYLEEVEVIKIPNDIHPRFSVQYVIRHKKESGYRGYAGRISDGYFQKNDKITILPQEVKTTIKSIEKAGIEIDEAAAGESVILRFNDEVGVGRGDLIVKDEHLLFKAKELEANLCWMDAEAASEGNRYILRHAGRDYKCVISKVKFKINVNDNSEIYDNKLIELNDICRVIIRTGTAVYFDKYGDNRETGSFIIINENSNLTAGAGMLI